jgi:hypothetical protein
MKKISSKAISGVALAVILVLAATQIPASGRHGKGSKIEGTWRIQLTFRDCQTGAAGPTHPTLNTFLDGGSMIATPSASPALVRTGHGVWKHAGGRNFINTIVFFGYNPTNGAFAGTQKVTRHLELEEGSDEFTSTDSFEMTDPSGTVISSGCATGRGQRLE